MDRKYSGKIHEGKAHIAVEVIILIFAGMFNRGYGFTSFLTTYLYAVTYPEEINKFLGYSPE